MSESTYVYAIYIAAKPEQVWQGLTSNEFIQQYWPEWRIESDWQPGSTVSYYTQTGQLYSQGEVIECNPPFKLSYTWPASEEDKTTEVPERLTWEITLEGPSTVKLRLVHEHINEAWYTGVSNGWPKILSSLKSLLERGQPLVFPPPSN